MSRSGLHRPVLSAALLSLGLAAGAMAQGGAAGTSPSTPPATATTRSANPDGNAAQTGALAAADRRFVEKAAMGGMAEVELGQLAQSKASSEQVRQFAQHMVDDHGKANKELQQIASSKSAQMPSSLDNKHKKTMDKLSKLSGAEFDRAYMKIMVSDHKDTVDLFEKEAKSGKDADLKRFASTTLPTLQDHLKMARAAQEAVKHEKKGGA